jgi:glycosyltransferase involved in cell wall biosynthesis
MSPTPRTPAITKSLVIPVYRNEANLPDLLAALTDLSKRVGEGFETVFVVDGSPDACHRLLSERLPDLPFASQLIALSRNFGAFPAIRCGLENARGRVFAVLAADLQEPPELVETFFQVLEADEADVVFGRRTGRADGWLARTLSNLFWGLYRRLVIPDIPPGGVDVFGCNDAVRQAVLRIEETNSSLVTQLFWVGFRRHFVPYRRRERAHGKSAWTFRRKFQYMLDSVFSFSDLPIMALLWLGLLGCAGSLALGAVVFGAWLLGLIPVPGYAPIMLAVLFTGSLLLLTQGLIGCYIWRIAENSRRRPQAVVARRAQFGPGAEGER